MGVTRFFKIRANACVEAILVGMGVGVGIDIVTYESSANATDYLRIIIYKPKGKYHAGPSYLSRIFLLFVIILILSRRLLFLF